MQPRLHPMERSQHACAQVARNYLLPPRSRRPPFASFLPSFLLHRPLLRSCSPARNFLSPSRICASTCSLSLCPGCVHTPRYGGTTCAVASPVVCPPRCVPLAAACPREKQLRPVVPPRNIVARGADTARVSFFRRKRRVNKLSRCESPHGRRLGKPALLVSRFSRRK